MSDCSHLQPSAGWEERFEKTFFQDSTGEKCDGWLAARGSLLYDGVDDGYCKIANSTDLKAFIASELARAKEEGRKESDEEWRTVIHTAKEHTSCTTK